MHLLLAHKKAPTQFDQKTVPAVSRKPELQGCNRVKPTDILIEGIQKHTILDKNTIV